MTPLPIVFFRRYIANANAIVYVMPQIRSAFFGLDVVSANHIVSIVFKIHRIVEARFANLANIAIPFANLSVPLFVLHLFLYSFFSRDLQPSLDFYKKV
jgi:hypothetical protein